MNLRRYCDVNIMQATSDKLISKYIQHDAISTVRNNCKFVVRLCKTKETI